MHTSAHTSDSTFYQTINKQFVILTSLSEVNCYNADKGSKKNL